MRYRPDKAARQDLWWRVLLAGAVPLLISIAINEYKFGSIYLFPLQDQVWTQVEPAPPRRARRQRRHDHRAPVLHHLVHGLPTARRHPVHRLLPVHHAARARGAGVRRGVHRPELSHRKRHRLHAAAAGDVPGRVRRRVPAAHPSCARSAADADAGLDPHHRRRHGLRLLRHPVLLGVRPGVRPRWRDHHGPAVRVPRAADRAGECRPWRCCASAPPSRSWRRCRSGPAPRRSSTGATCSSATCSGSTTSLPALSPGW